MKIRITDLLDQYHDESVMLTSSEAQQTEVDNTMKETVEIKQSKHRFGWKEGLAVAAAAAVFVLGGFGISKLLKKGPAQESPVVYESGESTVHSEPIVTDDTSDDYVPEQPEVWTDVELTPELQRQANRFLTYFAEQGVTKLNPEAADDYELVSFAHLYYKIHEPEAIVYQSLNEESYETLTEKQVNDLLMRLMNRTVQVEEDTDFTEQRGDNYAVHEMFRDGCFWFPAADGDMHSQFAVCQRVQDNASGGRRFDYKVYDFMGPMDLSREEKEALADLTSQQAEQDDTYIAVMSGAALVQLDDHRDNGWFLLSLNAAYTDQFEDPVDPSEGTDEQLSAEELRSCNQLLSRLAEQDVASLFELKEDEAALMTFAHNLAKLHPDAGFPITKQSRNGAEYDTMALAHVNGILRQLFGAEVHPEAGAEFPSPIYNDNEAKGFLEDGTVWFPVGSGYTYPCFAICTKAERTEYGYEDGDVSVDLACIAVEFNVYETTLEDFETGKAAEYCQLTAQEAEALAAQKVFYLTEKGTAYISLVGGGTVLDYERTWVEPEGWEEEFPQEYPVTEFRIEGEGFLQSGEINLYRYEQLPEAEGYMDILTGIAREALNSPDAAYAIDSPHDGYANWFMETPQGGSSVSGSSITGRFTYELSPAFDRILAQSQRTVTDRDAMEQAARDYVEKFTGITGELVLVGSTDDDLHYHDVRFTGLRDVVVPTVIYYFRSEENSRIRLAAQDGLELPVSCGDSSLDDLTDHTFAVTVWPDGTVVRGNNYITRARIVADGTIRMPDESDMDRILSFTTSFAENDTFVLEAAGVEQYSVYFGYGEVGPVLTVRYHFESRPEEHLTTNITMAGLLD